MLEAQGGVCAICNNPPKKKNLCVDHCHLTGEIRGLLCSRCNYLLGVYHENVQILFASALYLDEHNKTQNKYLEEAQNEHNRSP